MKGCKIEFICQWRWVFWEGPFSAVVYCETKIARVVFIADDDDMFLSVSMFCILIFFISSL